MEFGLVLLAQDPQIQEEIYQELINNAALNLNDNDDDNDKNSKIMFNFDNISKCIKFRAFVNETLRIACVAFILAPKELQYDCKLLFNQNKDTGICYDVVFGTGHEVTQKLTKLNKNESDYQFNYNLAKKSGIVGNLGYMLRGHNHEMGIYKNNNEINPMKINLSNWLKYDADGECKFSNSVNNNTLGQYGMAFSGGKRSCPGSALAIKELYGVLGNLLLNYKFSGPNGNADFAFQVEEKLVSVIEPQVAIQVTKRQ